VECNRFQPKTPHIFLYKAPNREFKASISPIRLENHKPESKSDLGNLHDSRTIICNSTGYIIFWWQDPPVLIDESARNQCQIDGDYAEDLAATMLATTLGLDFDAEQAWDQRKQHYRTSKLIIRTTNITHSATGDKKMIF